MISDTVLLILFDHPQTPQQLDTVLCPLDVEAAALFLRHAIELRDVIQHQRPLGFLQPEVTADLVADIGHSFFCQSIWLDAVQLPQSLLDELVQGSPAPGLHRTNAPRRGTIL